MILVGPIAMTFLAAVGHLYPFSGRLVAFLLPAVVLGIVLGWQILKRIPQKPFEWTLFFLTLFAAVWLIAA